MIKGVNHIGIAVRDLETSLKLFRTIFADAPIHREHVEEQKVDIASLQVGSVLVELTAPTDESSPIAGFLAKRGEGIHHIAFETDEVNTELKRLSDAGLRLINEQAVPGAHEMLIAFLHPKSTNGVLMELCQPKKAEAGTSADKE